jgi:hypothetical protein
MSAEIFTVGSDNIIDLTGLADEEGTLVEAPSVVVGYMEDLERNEIPFSRFTFTYQNVAGTYQGVLPAEAQIKAGDEYRLIVSVKTTTNRCFSIAITREAGYRES